MKSNSWLQSANNQLHYIFKVPGIMSNEDRIKRCSNYKVVGSCFQSVIMKTTSYYIFKSEKRDQEITVSVKSSSLFFKNWNYENNKHTILKEGINSLFLIN